MPIDALRRRLKSLSRLARIFRKSARASTFAFVAAASVPTVGAIGLSTDGAIGYLVRYRLNEAIDAAGLAAGRELDRGAREVDLRAFFDANFPDNFMGANVTGPTLTMSEDEWTLTITASAEVPTTFMRVLGIDSYSVAARTVIERQRSGMELALVMDNTGSMRSNGKIAAMRTAGQNLIDALYGSRLRIDNFWISVVPFTSLVNIGPDNALWLTDPADGFSPTTWRGCVEARVYPLDTTEDTYNHAPIVNAAGEEATYTWDAALYPNDVDNYWRHIDFDWDLAAERADWAEFGQPILIAHLNDELGYPHANTRPIVAGNPVHFEDLVDEWVHDELGLADHEPRPGNESLYHSVARVVLGYRSWHTLPSESRLQRDLESYLSPHNYGTWPAYDEARIDLLLTARFRRAYEWRRSWQDWTQPMVREENHWQGDSTGPNLNCGPPITPLTDNRATVEDAIAAMVPWRHGGTSSNLGLVWGWRSLSPEWRGLWDVADSRLPHDYDTAAIDKVVIILTDGINQMADHGRTGPLGSDYGPYGRVGEGRIRQDGTGTPLTGNAEATDEIDRRMAETCTAMKAAGITLYTITFQVTSRDTRELFRACASSEDHYFNSPSNQQLQVAFTQIATELSNLRIAQ